MIEVEKLTRCYGTLAAVQDVSFSIPRGEIVGLLGHNGAGKTTIMKMLMGYLEPSAGRIVVDSRRVPDERREASREMGYLPETPFLYPDMRVCDYLDYAAQLHGVRGPLRARAVRAAMEKTRTLDRAMQRLGTLSRGYQQRVGLAQAIVHEPRILILDEPTNGLDPAQIQQTRELIRSLRDQATVILSTHILQEVDALCERVLIMRGGRLALDSGIQALRRGAGLRLVCDSPRDGTRHTLEPLVSGPVELQERRGDRYEYRLAPVDGCDLGALAADINDRLVRAGHRVFELGTQTRSLESVFREINEQAEEVAHAA